MDEIEPLIGFVIVILFFVLVIFFSTKKLKTIFPPVFRKLGGALHLRNQIGLSVEDGTRLHLSLGSGSLIDPNNTSALVGLSTLNRISQLASSSDLPPSCTSGNGSIQILSQDVSRHNSQESNSKEQTNQDLVYLSGVTPFSYALGSMDAMHDSGTSANVFIGNFGAEVGFLCEAARNEQAYTLAGSDSLIAQSVFFALANDTLIGEELYALPAYLGVQGSHQASLRVQDIFRMLIILVLVGGIILQIIGSL